MNCKTKEMILNSKTTSTFPLNTHHTQKEKKQRKDNLIFRPARKKNRAGQRILSPKKKKKLVRYLFVLFFTSHGTKHSTLRHSRTQNSNSRCFEYFPQPRQAERRRYRKSEGGRVRESMAPRNSGYALPWKPD